MADAAQTVGGAARRSSFWAQQPVHNDDRAQARPFLTLYKPFGSYASD